MKQTAVRAISLARAGYGAALLCAPGAAIGLCTGRQASPRARAVARLLGCRHLAQAAMTATSPSRAVLAIGAQVDLAHALSMVALGAADRPLRRAPLSDALVAAGFAALGAVAWFGAERDGQLREPTAETEGGTPCISASEQS